MSRLKELRSKQVQAAAAAAESEESEAGTTPLSSATEATLRRESEEQQEQVQVQIDEAAIAARELHEEYMQDIMLSIGDNVPWFQHEPDTDESDSEVLPLSQDVQFWNWLRANRPPWPPAPVEHAMGMVEVPPFRGHADVDEPGAEPEVEQQNEQQEEQQEQQVHQQLNSQ